MLGWADAVKSEFDLPQNVYDLTNDDDLKNDDDLNNEDNLKN